MDFNKNCNLFIRDIYSYDIPKCHYLIMERLGFDMSDIPKDDKLQRNIKIGLLMKNNPDMIDIIRTTTISLIDEYITRNSVKDNEVILRQYDGMYLTKYLTNTNLSIPLELRDHFFFMIISPDKKSFITYNDKRSEIKGVPNRYSDMDSEIEKLMKLNFLNKTSIFKGLHRIKESFFQSQNPKLFCIPTADGKFSVFLKDMGQIEISDTFVNIIDINDIDKGKYFDYYLSPFIESIVLEFA